MTWLLLVAFPVASALAVWSTSRAGARASTVLVVTAALTTIAATVNAALATVPPFLGGYVHADDTVRLFAPVVNVIFLGIAAYVRARIAIEPASRQSVFLSLVFLAACNLALLANHLLVMWIGLEASTFAAALMILRADASASRLASWRYLLFSSVGLGLVVLGMSCLTRSMEHAGREATLFLDAMPAAVAGPADAWRLLGVALILLGIGTKLGLAPMYMWLPEAYDEAPAPVAAMLGAVQFNVALVLLFRVVHVYRASCGELITGELVTIGLASVAVSTASIVATQNFKRLLAYASINHAGVIAIGLGLGQAASFGVLLYVLSNAFIKAILFLTAGKIEAHYGTKDTRAIAGLIKDLPYSGLFLMVGTFALLGFPPFGSFLGELLVLSALVTSGQMFVFAAFCALITISFVATGRTIFPMIWGQPKQERTWPRQRARDATHKLIFLVLLLVLGIYIPPQINALMTSVAQSLEGP
ncbi:MAG TPA: proton-conducting transporter membrane subunit [Kofleriaceae bacterium]|nr:proton-conducting transporter membrane subunit [Kofleriaceae bacterium]